MTFSRTNLRRDPDNLGSNFDGDPGLDFRAAGALLGLEESGLTWQHVPPNVRFPFGHTHATQEEVFIVVRGGGRFKLDDEIIDVAELDAVRVAPGTWRGYEAGPDGLDFIVYGAPRLTDPRGDVEGTRDWWTD